MDKKRYSLMNRAHSRPLDGNHTAARVLYYRTASGLDVIDSINGLRSTNGFLFFPLPFTRGAGTRLLHTRHMGQVSK